MFFSGKSPNIALSPSKGDSAKTKNDSGISCICRSLKTGTYLIGVGYDSTITVKRVADSAEKFSSRNVDPVHGSNSSNLVDSTAANVLAFGSLSDEVQLFFLARIFSISNLV